MIGPLNPNYVTPASGGSEWKGIVLMTQKETGQPFLFPLLFLKLLGQWLSIPCGTKVTNRKEKAAVTLGWEQAIRWVYCKSKEFSPIQRTSRSISFRVWFVILRKSKIGGTLEKISSVFMQDRKTNIFSDIPIVFLVTLSRAFPFSPFTLLGKVHSL